MFKSGSKLIAKHHKQALNIDEPIEYKTKKQLVEAS